MRKPLEWQIVIVLIVGVFGVSLSAIWIRLAVDTFNPDNKVGFSLFLAASRLIMAALFLLPSWNFKSSKTKPNTKPTAIYYAIAAGICLALHFATWITSLSYTSIAASTVLVTTNPIWVGLISWWWYKEKLSQKNVVGIAIALCGGIVVAIAGGNISGNDSNPNLGNILALIGSVMSSLYIILGSQAQRQGLSTSNYIAIAYSVAAVCLLPLPFLYQTSYFNYPAPIYLYILLMAITSQLIGHSSLNWLVRWISPTIISLSLLFEPVVASFIGAIVFNEIPTFDLLIGGLTIVLGIIIYSI